MTAGAGTGGEALSAGGIDDEAATTPRPALPGGPKRGFAGWSPPARLAAWLGAVYVIGALVQAGAWLTGSGFDVFGDDGRELLRLLAVVGLVMLAMHDDQPLSATGLALTDRWLSRGVLGFGVGFVGFAGYLGVLVATGAFGLKPHDHWYGWFGFTLIVPLALVSGYLLQIVFSGYMLGELRRSVGIVVAIVIVALLFGFVHRMNEPWRMLVEDWPKLVGLGLLAAVLAILRLITGDIVLSGGILAGVSAADRINRDTGLAREPLDTALVSVFAPGRDPLRSPVVWAMLAAALVGVAIVLWRRGPARRGDDDGVPVSLKRVYAFGMITSAAPLDVWLARLHDARWRVPPLYWPRLSVALLTSTLSTVVNGPERLATMLLSRRRRGADPVFIVGVHRSGTTHLHNLLSLDEHLVPARMYQVLNPAGFLVTGWLQVPLTAVFLPWRRPMDGMRYNLFGPHEEEFAIANACGMSPQWGMTFPRRWAAYDRYIFPDRLPAAARRRWERIYTRFVAKLTLLTRRRAVLKNPYNTARVGMLRELYPDAKFIHLHRHPAAVCRSNRHLARAGHCLQQLQDPRPGQGYEDRFLENYRAMEDAFAADAGACGADQVVTIRYEDLVRDPIGEIRRAYGQLGLPLTPRFERRLRRYLDRHAAYRRTRHAPLPVEQQQGVEAVMGPYFEQWGYERAAAGAAG
ncbi:MAG: sulfotransferase family protein [Planctomycetota bacterium]